MAIYPCDQHGGRYRGPQRTAYAAVVNHASTLRERRRLCPDCFAILSEWANDVMCDPLGELELEPVDRCVGGDHDAPYAVFLTLYPGGEDRVDRYGRICAPCLAKLPGMLLFGREASI